MLKKRHCRQCDGTGITGKGFCQVCKGKGYTEVLDTPKKTSSDIHPSDINPIDATLLLHRVARNTTAEQFSRILEGYMNESE